MSTLDRRVQLLLHPEQYKQLEREASRTGQSVAGVIRAAIDVQLAAGVGPRAAAADRLLATADSSDVSGQDWSTTKAALVDDLAGRVE